MGVGSHIQVESIFVCVNVPQFVTNRDSLGHQNGRVRRP